MSSVATAAPTVCSTTQPGLATAQTAINATAAGALNLASIGLIMLGIAIMIGGFMLIRGYRGGGQ
jgi:hypothetical protein